MTDGKNLFDQPINSDLKTYENIRKIATGQQDDYTTGLLGYSYFKVNYKIIAIDLSKQQVLDADLRAIQLTENLDKRRKHNNLLYYWRIKRNCVILFIRNCKSFAIWFLSI